MQAHDNTLKKNALNAEQVREALNRVLASPGFVDAGRLGSFVQFLVEQTLAGQAGQIKESVIGVSVFQRDPSYDPRIDPIVRVEARRLRNRLAEYYEGAGKADPVIIELPKGSYVPVFRPASDPDMESVPARRRVRWLIPAAYGLAILVAAVWFAARTWQKPDAARVPPSVAVMPFVNLSQDAGNEYFSDGLTEELIDGLARIEGLRVVARSSVFQYKGKPQDVREIGQKFGARAVVEGSVRKSGDRLRITAQLVNAADGYHLWSQTYDRDLKDIFAIQEEIAHAIITALRVKLRVGGEVQLARRYTENIEAYSLYLQARYQWNRMSAESLRLAVDYAEQALKKDPKYAPAFALLAQIYAMMGYYHVQPPSEAWPKAREAAEKAIAIDDSLAEAHSSLGFVLGMHYWDWAASEKAFRRALELSPGSVDAHCSYAIAWLIPHARLDESNAELAKALELDPYGVWVNLTAAYSLLISGQYDRAIDRYGKTIQIKSDFPDLWWDKGMACALAGRKEEAIENFRRSSRLKGGSGGKLGLVESALIKDEARVRELKPQIAEWSKRPGVRAMEIAYCYAGAGEKDRAFEWIGKAIQQRDAWVPWLKVDPRLNSLRDDPRMDGFLRDIGVK